MDIAKIILYPFFLLIIGIVTSCDYYDLLDMAISPSSVNDRFEKSMQYNNINGYSSLNTSSEEYELLNIADIHVGETENLEKFITAAQTINPTAIIINGDFVSGHQEDYGIFDTTISKLSPIPYFKTLGNHELYFDGWCEFQKRYGTSIYYFTINTPTQKDLFICLDSGSGTLGDKQMEWLNDFLNKNRTKYRYCFIFTHVNLFRIRHTLSTNPNTEELYVMLDIFDKYNVDMVLTGHDHIEYLKKIGNTTHISINALKDGVENAGFLKLKVTNSLIENHSISID